MSTPFDLRTPSPAKSAAPAGDPRRDGDQAKIFELGRWELLEVIGQGRYTRVYGARAAGAPLDQPAGYAMKVLEPRWEGESAVRETFVREAYAGRKFSHRHLIPVLAASLEPPYYLVMPLLTGRTVAACLDGGRPLSVAKALWIARQVAEALSALEAEGWMHGDVKPSNIFVSDEGHATLIDLGFACRHAMMRSAVSRPLVGTLQYVAPETVTSSHHADIRSDFYSLAVTLFEMLTGRAPFLADDPGAMVEQHRLATPPDLRTLVPQLPTELAQLVRRMLAKDPLRRPQTAAELIDRLTALEIATFAARSDAA